VAGDNALYVEGGTTLSGAGIVHGVSIGALTVGGINTQRIDVLPAGVAITAATFITANAVGAANMSAGGALSLAGGDYIEYNSDEHRFINTSTGNQNTTISVGRVDGPYNVSNANPLIVGNSGSAGTQLVGVTSVNATPVFVFGLFENLSSVPSGGAFVPTVIPVTVSSFTNGMSISGNGIQVNYTGIYEHNFSIQFDKSGGGTDQVTFWLRVNGNDVPNSASSTTIQGTNGQVLGTLSVLLSLNANDIVEHVFASGDPTVQATYYPPYVNPPNPYDAPAVPSIIATMKLLK
jgi:hypothetical protein